MHWTAAFGLALLLASLGILAWVVPHSLDQGTGKERSTSGDDASLEATIRERLRRRQFRMRQVGFVGGTALLLGAVFLILLSRDLAAPPQAGPWIPTVPGTQPGAGLPGSTAGPTAPPPEVSVWRPAFFIPALVFAAVIVAGVFLIVSRSLLARLSGASLLFAATMTSQFHLIKEFKFAPGVTLGSSLTADQVGNIVDARIAAMKAAIIKELEARIDDRIGKIDIKGVVDSRVAVLKVDLLKELKAEIDDRIGKIDIKGVVDSRIAVLKVDLLKDLKAELKSLVDKIEINFDKIGLEARFDTYLRQIGALGPEHLGSFVGFESGKSAFATNVKGSIEDVCNRWRQRTDYQDGFLLVVGATDRIPLGPAAKLRYESNFGLARARAEEIKSRIVECGVPARRILAMVSGPRTTPERESQSIPDSGYPQDRMVDVWAIWSLRDRR
jgi:hypothetical protein